MSKRNESDKKQSVYESDLERSEKSSLDDIEPTEGIFRGFPRPTVVIPRIDVSPYLSPKTRLNLPKPILKKPSYDKFSAKCSVNIVRDDLDVLKALLKRKSHLVNDLVNNLPSNMKCKICKKVYSSSKKLLNHQENKHMIIKTKSQKRVSFSDQVTVHELKEYHKCRKCSKIFENYKALKAHMKLQHKKRKCYICNFCNKKFVDRMFFKVHIKLHCESCGQLFSNKMKCLMHKRSVCKILKLHQCKTCNLNFFKLMDLKDHSYEHISTCYVCDICKDQCQTKCEIAHHIYFLHSKRIKKRNLMLYVTRKLSNESLYLCKFCDESSVDKDLIERHVQLLPDLNNRVMTGYKDYYFCDQCLKKFNTEQDMLQHKWSHFLKTSDNSQIRQDNRTAEKNDKKVKTTYNANEKIPDSFLPTLILERIKIDDKLLAGRVSDNLENDGEVTENSGDSLLKNMLESNPLPMNNNAIVTGSKTVNKSTPEESMGDIKIKKSNSNDCPVIIDLKSKKTIVSKFQCPNCSKYYSNNYCLHRHIETQHSDFENLRCKVCEETFAWPSLLHKHKCIRLPLPEMPFDDARPEISFDNLHQIPFANSDMTNGDSIVFDDLNLTDCDDLMNAVDFEIPAPVVELTEYDSNSVFNNVMPNLTNDQTNQHIILNKANSLQSAGYKLVMQEVPIEF